ncbi:capsule biosynthesis GfcC family protein [uncultured Halopseudomonas sp.]|uniref:capsule biosynthesis GfcC family protein n=1 Tax=uncultured Halopseudomonas sp. TaxID=2901193 RepID=UPI0030EBE42F|tara:strand:- start:4621 stop:5415 length:795 start_codon:yes stop_codon:yes gene_type:complete
MKCLLSSLAGAVLAGLMCSQAVGQPESDNLVVHIDGQVLNPGSFAFAPSARLSQAAATGQVSSSAWFLGAALLRESAIEPQVRLKAGVIFELEVNAVHAKATGNTALLELAQRLHALVAPFPITGRVVAEMNPLKQLLLPNNELLENGDRLLYPLRTDQVRVVGAVEKNCILPYVPGMQPVEYLESCPRHVMSDPSNVYLVQPNGTVNLAPVAAWNLRPANVATGAIIYVPLRRKMLSPEATGLNEDMAALLATQYQLGGRFDE